jgi:hypothetical protein
LSWSRSGSTARGGLFVLSGLLIVFAPPLRDGRDENVVNLFVESPDDGHLFSFPSARVCGYILL